MKRRMFAGLLAALLTGVTLVAQNYIYTTGPGTTTTSQPFTATQTWNAGGVSFVGLNLAFTETASAAGSKYLQILGGASGTTEMLSLQKDGILNLPKTSNQLVLGTTNTTTLSFSAPAASRVVTFGDPLSAANVMYSVGSYKLARGTITLDGSNPSSAATGLVSIVSCSVDGPAAAAIPGDDPISAQPFINGTSLDIYAWGTNGTDPTPVASTNNTAVFYWICVGT